MVEVLKYVCEVSSEAANAVLSHLRIIGEKEGLIECSLTETPSVEDLSLDQIEFRRISLDCLLCCPAIDRQDIFPGFVHCVNGILVVDDDQLRLVAREHALKFSDLPEPSYLFFNTLPFYKGSKQYNVLPLLRDLETVLVTCYGDTTAEVEKYKDLPSSKFVLKKEGGQMTLYLTRIDRRFGDKRVWCVELLHALTSAPESPPQKPVDCVQNRKNSNETESKSGRTLNHSLSFVREIRLEDPTSEELTAVNNALPFVNGPRVIDIYGTRFIDIPIFRKSFDVQLIESLVSLIPFTNYLHTLRLSDLNLTANSATDIFKLLHQAHNLHELDLSGNNLHSTVSDLAENLHHLPQLTQLNLSDVAMGDKECRLLAESLKFVPMLQVLNLSSNLLGQGISELAKHLPCVPHLTVLHLDNTQMGEKEITAVACALKDLPELEWLDLSHNPLGRAVIELTQHLSSIPQLGILWLYGVKMTKKETSELCAAVKGRVILLGTDYHVSFLLLVYLYFTLCIFHLLILEQLPVTCFNKLMPHRRNVSSNVGKIVPC